MSVFVILLGLVAVTALVAGGVVLFRSPPTRPAEGPGVSAADADEGTTGVLSAVFSGFLPPRITNLDEVGITPMRRLRSALMLLVTVVLIAGAVGLVLGLVLFALGFVLTSVVG